MISAYYSKGCDSEELFHGLKAEKLPSFKEHLNKHNVLYFDMQSLILSAGKDLEYARKKDSDKYSDTSIFYFVEKTLIEDIRDTYHDLLSDDEYSLSRSFQRINAKTKEKFIIIIDEWDSVFRNNKNDEKLQKDYLDFLRSLFKSDETLACIDLAYMTGILPIKKYGGQSPMNGYKEFTMTDPSWFAPYVGFTEEEVKNICDQYKLDFSEAKRWYDGYLLNTIVETDEDNEIQTLHIYSPNSVVQAAVKKKFGSYWTATETYEPIKEYIMMNFDGLKDAVIRLLAGEFVKIDIQSFQNDMTSMDSKDDVLSLLVHLGYLGYKEDEETVFIPNEEVREELARTVKDTGWKEIVEILRNSDQLLNDTINGNEESVAKAIEFVHEQNTSILNYNNENALSFVVSLAYISARKDYTLHRELAGGKGYADIVFIPRRKSSKPALVIELKWNKESNCAIQQIKERNYPVSLEDYKGNILLVGISYDKESKQHTCKIESYPQ